MRRITGTHVYSYVKCPRLAALDLHLPRSERRPATAAEEFAAARGRDFEAVYVADLGAVAPAYPDRDFAAGAAATRKLLADGAPIVHQAVLSIDDRLGLPDLLRKLPGGSDLGDHHYEVIDVKTSGRARGDQVLQVVFYSQLLAEVQGRMPEHGALILKDRSEERFAIADYLGAGREVLAALGRLRADVDEAQPFLQAGCATCYFNHRCLPELAARNDLSLVMGMSRGAAAILRELGVATVQDLATFHPEGARQRGNLDAALVRRLRRAAQAHLLGQPILEVRPPERALDDAAILHVLADPFADRVLALGTLYPAREDGQFEWQRVATAADEVPVLRTLIAALPRRTTLLHFGETLPRMYEKHAFARDADTSLEERFVDLGRRLRAAAIQPAPAFGLEDLVRLTLRRDPRRVGNANEAALWATQADGDAKMGAKLRGDLGDLAALVDALLRAERAKPSEKVEAIES
ncbi:MAG: TM0106 family RecB-like putative nuclease [Planctomycetota bacterium]